GFPYHSPLRTLLQCRLESGSCRRTVIDDEYTDQANSSRCRNARVAAVPPSLFMRLGRWKPYPEDLTGARIGRYEMRIAVPPRELDPRGGCDWLRYERAENKGPLCFETSRAANPTFCTDYLSSISCRDYDQLVPTSCRRHRFDPGKLRILPR